MNRVPAGRKLWMHGQPEEVRVAVFGKRIYPFACNRRLASIPQFPEQGPSFVAACV
jgi:hypothetical protein